MSAIVISMKKNYLTGYKLLFGLLGFSAIVTEIVAVVERGTFDAGNFFSYFTIESNILAAISLILGALAIYAGKKSTRIDFFRGAVTFYMIVTGIIFAVLLSGIENATLTAVPWDNIVLHYIMPVVIAIDWFMDRPVRRFAFRRALLWITFPVAYLVYSLIRGPIVGWYPYPFLNPAYGGYTQVAITSLVITVFGFGLIYVISRVAVKTKKK